MKNMKKIIAVLMSLTAITMTTSAFAAEGKGTAEYDAETKAVTLDAKEDLASATGQLTVVILPVNAGKEGYESITSGNIYYINQAEAGDGEGKFNDIIKAMKVKTVKDKNGNEVAFNPADFEIRIGGTKNEKGEYQILVYEFGEKIEYGNVDGNYKEDGTPWINGTDAVYVLQYVVDNNITIPHPKGKDAAIKAANVDGNYKEDKTDWVNGTDAVYILQYVVDNNIVFPALK